MAKLFEAYHTYSDREGPHVLITAGVHGDEYEPVIAARKLAGEMGSILKKGTVTVVPVVNVSAAQLKSRCGADGLDLARTCPGNPAGSITEQVASEISGLIKKADYYIDLHTGGSLFDIAPLAGYMLHASPVVLDAQRLMAEAFGFPVIWGTDRYAMGRTLSVARDANIPAIYVEYGGPEPVSATIIEAYRMGCLNVLAALSLISPLETVTTKYSYWVEDHRDGSGHLQSKTPAPGEGMFLPVVKPGNRIRCGDTWGVIQQEDSGEQTQIKAAADGVVLLTRVKGRVEKNDSLGGILPITEPGKIQIDEHS